LEIFEEKKRPSQESVFLEEVYPKDVVVLGFGAV
jgi:hypothetical protein